jgi:predicted SAM-dependent methyltransferase
MNTQPHSRFYNSLRHMLRKSTILLKIYHALPRDILKRLRASRALSRRSRAIIDDYMRHHAVRKLQISAGPNNLCGWLNTDVAPSSGQAYLNVLQPFPIPASSFQYVGSEHGFEHITYDEGQAMLKECYRILVPGGTIRIATPNLLQFLRLFQKDKTEEEQRFVRDKLECEHWPHTFTACSILNCQMRMWGHKFLYDPETLRMALDNAGFQDITTFPVGESDVPDLRGVEFRDHGSVRVLNAYETIVMQAVRP